MVAILVQLDKRTVAILDFIIMQKLFIWPHGGHFGLKNKEKAAILNYLKDRNMRTWCCGGHLSSAKQKNSGHIGFIIMQKLFIWPHGGHFGLRNKEKVAILNYLKDRNMRTWCYGGHLSSAKQKNSGHIKFHYYAKIIHMTSWRPFWIKEPRKSCHIELFKRQKHAQVMLWRPS